MIQCNPCCGFPIKPVIVSIMTYREIGYKIRNYKLAILDADVEFETKDPQHKRFGIGPTITSINIDEKRGYKVNKSFCNKCNTF